MTARSDDTVHRDRPKGDPKVSIAVPIFNEAGNLPELIGRLQAVLDGLPGGPHEMVFVDDGSSDGSAAVLGNHANIDSRIVVIELSRNFGHQTAVTAAIDHVAGDVTVVMDGDLQDLPEDIPSLLEYYQQGYDVVYARRIKRKENPLLRLAYHLAYRFISMLATPRLPLDVGDFSLLSRRVVDALRQMPERHRYVRGLRAWVGFRQIGIDVERAPRRSGESKYSLSKLVRLAVDGIVSFSIIPLRTSILIGLAGICMSVAYTVYAVAMKLFYNRSPAGFTALIVVIVFLAALQFVVLGVLGEYVGRIYEETKRRPLYLVRKITRG
jgi:dolichol-phosphate mannosyltransferase